MAHRKAFCVQNKRPEIGCVSEFHIDDEFFFVLAIQMLTFA
jgi:hypothetical protein